MKIALTGATGLVGSRFFDLLKSHYEIIPISSSFKVDVTDKKSLDKFLKTVNPSIIVHLAAKTNVDKCEEDRESDVKALEKQKVYSAGKLDIQNLDSEKWKNSTSAFGINVIGTKNLADYSIKNGIKMIYASTDFVFDGTSDEGYFEDSTPNPINWYGQTKLWGEDLINDESLITRISYPYGFRSAVKKDLIWTLAEVLEKTEAPRLVFDQIITPTFMDDIINGLHFLIEKNIMGIIHLSGNNYLSPYEIAVAIAREFNLNEGKIQTVKRCELYKGRAKRPFKMMLKNDKIKNLGFEITDFFEALRRIRQ